MAGETFLIAGLGNIGQEYVSTRHNMGFMVLDAWAQASNAVFLTARYGDIATIKCKGRNLVLLKPSTYMNLSGNAVRYWMNELGVEKDRVLVICDDINLPFGTIRMRRNGSNGGHNGLGNIIDTLGSPDFPRIRIGVGHGFRTGEQIDYVLGKFSEEEIRLMDEICRTVYEGVKSWALAGIDIAMNQTNKNLLQNLQNI